MIGKRTGRGRLVTALTACALLTSGCGALSVNPDELPGVYRNDATGGQIQLNSDRTFSATDVLTGTSSDSADFKGRWEYLESTGYIYLSIDENGGLGLIAGIPLFTDGDGTVYFLPDPDEPPLRELTRTPAP